jgi:TetR/AcrR family transcriptional repressor of nem operon
MAETRDALIGTGLRLLIIQAYAATGVQQIVSEAGVPKGSFYNHFVSKEEYGAAVLDRYMDLLLPPLEAGGADPIGTVRAFHETLIRVLGTRPGALRCMLGAFATEVGEDSTALRTAMASGIERWVGAYERLFAQAQALGQIRADIPARQVAEVFWNQWQGGLAQMRVRGSTDSLSKSLEALLSTLLAPPSPTTGTLNAGEHERKQAQ